MSIVLSEFVPYRLGNFIQFHLTCFIMNIDLKIYYERVFEMLILKMWWILLGDSE